MNQVISQTGFLLVERISLPCLTVGIPVGSDSREGGIPISSNLTKEPQPDGAGGLGGYPDLIVESQPDLTASLASLLELSISLRSPSQISLQGGQGWRVGRHDGNLDLTAW